MKDGYCVTIGSKDGTVRVWEAAKGRLTAEYQCFRGDRTALCFSGNGEVLAVAGWDGDVKVVHSRDGSLIAQGIRSAPKVSGIAVSETGGRIVCALDNGEAFLWCLHMGEGGKRFPLGGSPEWPFFADFARNGWVAIGRKEKIRTYYCKDPGNGFPLACGEEAGGLVGFSPDGNRLLVQYGPDQVQVWRLNRAPGFAAALALPSLWLTALFAAVLLFEILKGKVKVTK
jgi:WD40 repeat protein